MNITRRVRRCGAAAGAACLVALGAGCGGVTEPEDESEASVVRIAIEPPAAVLAEAGESTVLTAFGVRSDGSEVALDVTWSIDDPTVASIDESGFVLAARRGFTVVRATAVSLQGLGTVAVDPDTVPPKLVRVAINRNRVDVGTSNDVVRMTAVFSDDRSGARRAVAHFDGPLGAGITGVVALEKTEEDPETGDATFEGFLDVPAVVGVGTWTLSVLTARDAFGNSRSWGQQQLAAAGWLIQFEATATAG